MWGCVCIQVFLLMYLYLWLCVHIKTKVVKCWRDFECCSYKSSYTGPRVTETMDLNRFNAPVLKDERGSTRTAPWVKRLKADVTHSLCYLLAHLHTCTHTQVLWPRSVAFSDLQCNSSKAALKTCCMCAYTHIHRLGLPWDDETVWNCSFLELMILQSSSLELMGPYSPDVHFETRFMSALSTLGKEHIIYHPLSGSQSIIFSLFGTFKACQACTDAETHTQKHNTKKHSNFFKYFPKLFCPTIP